MDAGREIQLQRYHVGVDSLKHYSNAILNIRTVTIAQGLAILTAEGLLAKEREFVLLTVAAVFGMALAVFLYLLQWNYKRYFDAILDNVCKCEEQLFDDLGQAVWTSYVRAKNNVPNFVLIRIPSLHGLFCLLLVSQFGLYVVGGILCFAFK